MVVVERGSHAALCVCVRACVRACARVRVCSCNCVCMCVCLGGFSPHGGGRRRFRAASPAAPAPWARAVLCDHKFTVFIHCAKQKYRALP